MPKGSSNSSKPKKPQKPTRLRSSSSTALSPRTKRQIESLPKHAQSIYKKAHANALEQYKNPADRRGGKKTPLEETVHKVAWSAVKKKYHKTDNKWKRKSDTRKVNFASGSGKKKKEKPINF